MSNRELHSTAASAERAAVVHPELPGSSRDARRAPEVALEEACGLAEAIGLDIRHRRSVRLTKMRAATLIGPGSVAEIGAVVAEEEIGVVVVDAALSPVQQRNLERAWKTKVIDRTGLILEIFGDRARTAEGRLQVELAALSYQRTRLVRSWTHLERQRGGAGFMGGPGESQIELDRRQIDDRIIRLKRELDEVKRTRQLHRRRRQSVPYPVVALVGYTNAGKSTLFNRLTGAAVEAKDMLFATLDPTMRAIVLPSGRRVILSDTVGFISNLPTQLIAAFRATLEEVLEADVLLHVRDVANPDTGAQKRDVLGVLNDLGVGADADRRIVEVLNKIDLLPPETAEQVEFGPEQGTGTVVGLSAVTGQGCDRLLEILDARLAESATLARFSIPLRDGASLSWLYRHGEVTSRRDDAEMAHVEVRLDDADRLRFEKRLLETGAT